MPPGSWAATVAEKTSRKLTGMEQNYVLGGALIAIIVIGVILMLSLEFAGLLEFCREVCLAPESSPA